MLPVIGKAEVVNGTTGDCTWILNTETGLLTISGNGAMGNIGINVDNCVVGVDNRDFVKSVVIESGVTTIGVRSFYLCSNMTTVTIPESVQFIENRAFDNCPNLKSVVIPNGVQSIFEYTFWGCSSLTSVTIPESVTSIGDGAFQNCSSLTSVTIPES